MAHAMKKQVPQEQVENKKIRIILSSRKVKALENTCTQLVSNAQKADAPFKGPMYMPTRTLRITTMKSPCGEGTTTWDRFEMRVHKRVLDLIAPQEIVKKITSITIEPGVDVEVTVA
eukprot:TRINITY_DN32600_c0_g1_i1.p2 TRINITY_DN32600_c0_g1~~TRINITY_DN32600_c0_g1_i1.p2  ORF type:complete len:117 (+),score=48.52 TRINITY_DN32600_c0_g1_i1:47-397(+)